MRTKSIKRPNTYREPHDANRAGVITYGPPRFDSGKHKGKIVPTRAKPEKVIKCARCKLPSYRGLPPLEKALSYDQKTGDAIDVYVHQGCPSNAEQITKDIEGIRAKEAEEAERKRKTDFRRRRTWRPWRR